AAVATILLTTVEASRRPKWNELSSSYSFAQYIVDFRKVYQSPEEHASREAIFYKNLDAVLTHNKDTTRSYKQGVNYFTDLDESELSAMRGGRFEPSYAGKYAAAQVRKTKDAVVSLPPSVDYRTRLPAVLTAVKDQGNCGDCWAHAVTEAIESAYAIATGELFVLSQQQVTSCTPPLGTCYSCNGSYPSVAYDYVAENGLTEEWIYPFESYNNTFPACKQHPYLPTPVKTIVNISGYINIQSNDQQATMEALVANGPLSILVDASLWGAYESGIFDGCSYAGNTTTLDHAVNLVGYGSEDGIDYWIVRNSWAPSWGESGYIRVARPTQPQCGEILGSGTYGCFNNPTLATGCGECSLLYAPQFPIVSV
ncbi:cathepsin-L cysteine peptidase, putative, partial [Bodo saltans]